jgi:hypothetical protein
VEKARSQHTFQGALETHQAGDGRLAILQRHSRDQAQAITVGPMAAHIVLPWTHRLFSNLKRWGLGVYHGLRRTNLQYYLDEFVFRFNRRRTRRAPIHGICR